MSAIGTVAGGLAGWKLTAIAIGFAVLCSGITYWVWRDSIYKEGYAACVDENAKAVALQDAKDAKVRAEQEAATARHELEQANRRAARPNAIAQAAAAAKADPVFAATARPPALAEQRQRELQAWARATGGTQ